MQRFSDGATGDLSHLQSTMQAIEQACNLIQIYMNPEAQATILALRQSPRPYHSCQFILENSQLANARFQAAAAIQDAAIREWGFLTSEEKRSLITFCLHFVMKHANSTDGYVQVKVSAVGAQLMKRGWPDFTEAEKESFFSEVKKAVLGIHGVDVQFTGLNFLESLVSEFSPSTSSPMGLPTEFHVTCQASLELDYLKTFYCWAQDSALNVTDKIVECRATVSEVKVCSAALRLMLQILNWDFCHIRTAVVGTKNQINGSASGIRHDIMLLKKSGRIVVQPGPTWHDALISSGHIGWLLGLYGTLRQTSSGDAYWIDSPLAFSARKLIVQFCSLTGTIFPSDNGEMQEKHLLQLLSGILQWINPPGAIRIAIEGGKSDSEMLDGCRALLSIATLTTPMGFDKLLKSISPFGTISLLSALTCEFKAHVAINNEEENWSSEACDVLLDIWNVLLEPTEFGKSELSPEAVTAAARAFNVITESELKAAAASAFDDGDDCDHFQASISAMDERLNSYALIARAAADVTIPFLLRLFLERFALLHQGRGTTDPTCALEELYSLLLITGHVVADIGEGETALIPEALQVQFLDVVDEAHHPVVLLSGSIINFAEQSLNPEIRAQFFSPRVMEALIWFLARWSDTYLMPLKPGRGNNCTLGDDGELLHESQLSRRALLNFCGEHNQGKSVLDIIVRVSTTTLISYPGENDLQRLTCFQLLPALVRRRNVCVHLVALDSWRNLANAFANERNLFSLAASFQRSLAETLCRSASGLKDTEASNQYVRNLMGQMIAYLVDISTKNDLKAVGQQPDVILSVSCLLERLRGAARATQPRTQKAIFDMGVAVMNPILTLLEIYKNQSAVVYMLLKFVVDWVDGQIVFLEAKETAILISFCMQLLQIYSSHNIGKISLSLSSSLLSEAKTEKYKDLRALLQLLTNLCSKDLVDFSSGSSEAENTDIAQVVYLGLHIITPLISVDLLKYPKLCFDYFALLSHMLEVYPEKVAQLNAEVFAHIIGTLDFGIHHQDTEVVNMCLRALHALASYHYKQVGSGGDGLAFYAAGFEDPNGKFHEGVLSHFLQLLLHLLLFEEYSTELISTAADALLPLILCEQGLYQRLGLELLGRQDNPTLRSRLASALESLTSSNHLSSSLDRVNYQKFRKNLSNFLTEVRGFLRTI